MWWQQAGWRVAGGQQVMLLVLFLWFWVLFRTLLLRRRLLIPGEEEKEEEEGGGGDGRRGGGGRRTEKNVSMSVTLSISTTARLLSLMTINIDLLDIWLIDWITGYARCASSAGDASLWLVTKAESDQISVTVISYGWSTVNDCSSLHTMTRVAV